MSISQVLVESRKDDFLKKYRNKFTPEQSKKIFMLSRQFDTNQKYLMFLGKVISPDNFEKDLIKSEKVIENFIRYQQALKNRDINQYDTLKDIEDVISKHENKVRRGVKEVEGASIVFENDRFTVVTPKTHQASCFYGSGTKWCTASLDTRAHFDNYNTDGKLFYIIDKKAKSSNDYYKVALLQKYDGEYFLYDVKDIRFKNKWIVGTKEWDEIKKSIDDYLKEFYNDQIEIWSDKKRAEEERKRIQRINRERRIQEKLAAAEERKENDEWNLETNDSEEAEMANAVYEVLKEISFVDEEEGDSIYNLIPNGFDDGVRYFEWLGSSEAESEWLVGDWDSVYNKAVRDMNDLWDDIGIEGWNQNFIISHIDEDKVRDFWSDMYRDDIYDNIDVYFSEDQRPLSYRQESEIEKLKDEKEKLNEIIDDSDDEDEISSAEERIDEIEDEIDEILSQPDGEPTDEMIDEVLEVIVDEKMYDILGSLREYNVDLSDFIDVDSLIGESLDIDGITNALSTYDGNEYEQKINNTWYFIYRV